MADRDAATVLTVAQVAELFQLSTKTVERHLRGGTLRGAKIGAHWRIRREDADAWFDSLVPTRCERPPRTTTPRRRPAPRGSLRAVLDGGGTA